MTGKLVDMNEYVPSLPSEEPVVFVFGSHAHGPVVVDYVCPTCTFWASESTVAHLTHLMHATPHAHTHTWGGYRLRTGLPCLRTRYVAACGCAIFLMMLTLSLNLSLSFSRVQLSAAVALGRMTNAYEKHLGIL